MRENKTESIEMEPCECSSGWNYIFIIIIQCAVEPNDERRSMLVWCDEIIL